MQNRDLKFNNVWLCSDVGLVYSSFTETLPEPKAVYLDVPGGYPIDVSEALGNPTYGSGKHVLTFLLYADTETERLQTKARLIALLHGKRASYSLSWEEGTYTGRAVLAFEHRWDNVDVVTVTITHDPTRTYTESHYVYPTATSKTASYADVYDYLKGAQTYTVSVRLYQSGSAKLGNNAAVAINNTTASVGTAVATGSDGVPLYVKLDDWWIGPYSDNAQVFNSAHFPNPVDGEVTTDSDWTRSGTNLTCSNYASKQKAYVTVTKVGY